MDEAFGMTFEHGDNRSYLNSIAVGSSIEASLHQLPEVTAGELGTRPAAFGGDNGTHVAFAPRERVIRLGS